MKPEELVMEFLNSTYEKGARISGWDINSLKQKIPKKIKWKITANTYRKLTLTLSQKHRKDAKSV